MAKLIHSIYTSAALHEFTESDLAELLRKARENNEKLNISGMLLYTEGSFFQVLEGEEEVVDLLIATIFKDPRHASSTIIIREPIAKRSFGEWTMGYAAISSSEVNRISGLNDFFGSAACFSELNSGRAKKLLSAFREGRWRTKLTGATTRKPIEENTPVPPSAGHFSFAFQPIFSSVSHSIVSYEALIRGKNNEPQTQILNQVQPDERHKFDENCRIAAINLAAKLQIPCNLNLNFLPLGVQRSATSISSTIEEAKRLGIDSERIILEIDQTEKIPDHEEFARTLSDYRSTGIKIAIDNFGAGHSGLTLLDQYQPEIIAVNMNLVRNVDANGPRQAIVRGIVQTCNDLGIDIIAKGVESADEYSWLRDEGIEMFQGNFLAMPAFEQLPEVSKSDL